MKCYLCSGQSFTARKGAVRDSPALRILECDACGLVTLSSHEHIHAAHYAESGMHGAAVKPIDEWLHDCEPDDERRFQMLKSALTNGSILDFGCGAGGFLLKAKQLAARAWGVEPERRVRAHWGERLNLCATLADAGSDYDIVTAFHVVEHLTDPRSVLADLARCLNATGQLVIEVPSSEDALLTLYDSDAFQRFTYWSQHLYLFNAQTLRQLALQAGLRVTAIRQVQRYPLSNHLHWLSRARHGGHTRWSFIDTPALTEAYAAALGALGMCDTIVAFLARE